MDKDDRGAGYREWETGTVKILVATSALGLRIDCPHIRFMIHQGQNLSMVYFIQESGLAGPDGKEAPSIVFSSEKVRSECEWIEKKELERVEETLGGWRGMKEWVANNEVLRKVLLGEYVDGKGSNCVRVKDCTWCDVCNAEMEGGNGGSQGTIERWW
jgi:superfamily II DNA helicase RecQ